MSLLAINSSARMKGSNSRALVEYFSQRWVDSGRASSVIDRDLVKNPLPALSPADLVGVHGSHEVTDANASLAQHLALSGQLIDELKAADTVVFGLPMYNFGVPFYLKQWVDYICRAGVTFRYGENGPEGLTGVQRAVVITASGGTPIGSEADFASRYIEHLCGFIGIEHVDHINASGSKRTPELVLQNGRAEIDALIEQIAATA